MGGKQKDRHSVIFRRLCIFAGLAFLMILYPLLLFQVLSDPLQRTAADFLPFYAAGRISITKGIAVVYDWETQRQAENDAIVETVQDYLMHRGLSDPSLVSEPVVSTSEVNPFPHPPYIVPLLGLLARLDYLPAYIIWIVLMTILAALGSFVLVSLLPKITEKDFWMAWAGTFLFFPTFWGILNGQDSSVLLLAAAIWFWGISTLRDRTAGLGLGFVTIRPHMAIVLAPLFLFKRRKIWWWFFVCAGILILLSLFLLGRQGVANYLQILITSNNGEDNKFFNEELMINLIGILQRSFPNSPSSSIRTIGWVGYLVAIIFLCVVWIKSHKIEDRHIGLAVILTILGTTHFHYHDLVLLLIPIFGCLRLLLVLRIIDMETSVLILLGLSVTFFATSFLFQPLKYILIYLVMTAMLLLLWFPKKLFPNRIHLQEKE